MKKQKILSLALVLALCLGLVTPVLAASSNPGPDILSSLNENVVTSLESVLNLLGGNGGNFEAATATDEELGDLAVYCPLPGISSTPPRISIGDINIFGDRTRTSDADYTFSFLENASIFGVSYEAINRGVKNLFGRTIQYQPPEEAAMPNVNVEGFDFCQFNYNGKAYVAYGNIGLDPYIVNLFHVYDIGNNSYWVQSGLKDPYDESESSGEPFSAILKKSGEFYQVVKTYPMGRVPSLQEVKTDAAKAGSTSAIPTVAGFTDVAANSPFKAAIDWAVEQDITKGKTATTFGPGDTCTVSHILTFLWRANGRSGSGDNERTAVTAWAESLGIDTGSLNDPCTRAMAVTYMWKAAGSPAPKRTSSFSDVPASASYAKAVSWAVEQGITKGTTPTTFSPDKTCTRGQIVTFLYRAAQ